MHLRRFVLSLILLIPWLATAVMAANDLKLSYVVDANGKRVDAAMTRDGKATTGEIFVDSNGTVGFIDCDRKLISVDLTNVVKTDKNCSLMSSSLSKSHRDQIHVWRPRTGDPELFSSR